VAILLSSASYMVASGILTFLYVLIAWGITLLPVYTGLPTGLQNALTWIGGTGAGLSCIVPVDTYRAQILIIMYTALVLLGVRFFMWIFNRKMNTPDKA